MRDLSGFTGRNLSNITNRDLSEPAHRTISDDNEQFKDLGVRLEGYPYTYPFYYATGDARELGDPEA